MYNTGYATWTTCAPRIFSVQQEISLYAVDAYTLMDKEERSKFHLDLIFNKPKYLSYYAKYYYQSQK